jgi:large subunit ribosomal protein L23
METTKPAPNYGPDLAPHQVIIRPLVTEKGTHQATRYNAYIFQVHLMASKELIKAAIEHLFNVRVTKVRTQLRQGKLKRSRFKMGRKSHWKRAIVTLHEEDKIELL